MRRFSSEQRQLVCETTALAQSLVSHYYVLAPREWAGMRYEVRTQTELEPIELLDTVLAQVICYEYVKRVGQQVLEQGDLYRICLQDNRILATLAGGCELDLASLLLYVLTHELVHVVRFGQHLQRLDLSFEERVGEEQSVDLITQRIVGFSPGEETTRNLWLLPRYSRMARHA
ncbi:MAG: hypothetical protein AB1489_37810 [Acidobacteriota bacterium]